jgi:hypothetical protein
LSIRTVIVDLESIHTPEIPSVDKSLMESLANSIVNLRGVLRLPVICNVGIDEYEMLSGQIEFYAYIQARKFDESLPDRIAALLVDKKNEEAIRQQIGIVPVASSSNYSDMSNIAINNLDTKLERLFANQSKLMSDSTSWVVGNIEAKLEHLFTNQIKLINDLQDNLLASLKQSYLQQGATISQFNSGMDRSPPKSLPILEALNRLTEPLIEKQVSNNLAFLGDAKVVKIIKLLKAAKEREEIFTSMDDVHEMLREPGGKSRLIGEKTMLQVITRWH